MDDYPWYAPHAGVDLLQGDILEEHPAYFPLSPAKQTGEDIQVEETQYDIVVMTQSCDLANGKQKLVLVCPVWSFEAMGEAFEVASSEKWRKELRDGKQPGFHLLRQCDLEGLERPARVVALRSAFSTNREFLSDFAARAGTRLRLLPPYREHLAQAFARFLMRVGLPQNIPDSELALRR